MRPEVLAGWEVSQRHRTLFRDLPYPSVPGTKVPEGKELSDNGGSGRIEWESIKHSRCSFLPPVKGESDHRGRR